MNSGIVDFFAGCLINIVVGTLLIGLGMTIDSDVFYAAFVIVVPFSFIYGRRFLAWVSGPNTGMWLYTGNVGVAFAYISIDLFRQDKKFSKSEMEKLCDYFSSEFGPSLYNVTRAFVLKNKRKKVNLNYHIGIVNELTHRERLLFLYHLFSMAIADEKYTPEEDNYLEQLAKRIKISLKNFRIIKSNFIEESERENNEQQYRNSENKKNSHSGNGSFSNQFFSTSYDAYSILGVNKNAENKDIKKAYRKLLTQYHPDKLVAHSDLYKKMAKKKLEEIMSAYEHIKKIRGLK